MTITVGQLVCHALATQYDIRLPLGAPSRQHRHQALSCETISLLNTLITISSTARQFKGQILEELPNTVVPKVLLTPAIYLANTKYPACPCL